MDSNTSWSSQLRVRNACEECHKRKIKCMMSPDGGACRACKSTSRSCSFLPRQKCGRVPKKASGGGRLGTSNGTEECQNAAMLFSTSDIAHNYHPTDSVDTTSGYTTFGSGYLTPTVQLGDGGFFDETMELPFPDVADGGYLTPSDQGSRSSISSSSNESAGTYFTKSQTSPPILDWPSTQAQIHQDISSRDHERLCAQLLHECHQMQKQRENLISINISVNGDPSTKAVLQSTISSVDAICHAILEVAGNNYKDDSGYKCMPDNKLMSVTMAATFAVFEVCEVLAATSINSTQQYSDYTLMWKRLDLNLTQIRVSLSRLFQTGGPYLTIIRSAITRAKVLDNRIKSTVQDGYSDWEDGI